MNLSRFQPDLKCVIAAVSLLTLLSFALNIGLAWQQLGVYTLTLDDAWIHQTYARNLAKGAGLSIRATKLQAAVPLRHGRCCLRWATG